MGDPVPRREGKAAGPPAGKITNPVVAWALFFLLAPLLVAASPLVGFDDEQAIGLLVILPLLASVWLSTRGATAVSVYTVGIAGALLQNNPGTPTRGDVLGFAVVLFISAFAPMNSMLLRRRESRLRNVSEVARVAQDALRQPVPAVAGQWALAGRYESATPDAVIGGDVLDVVETPTGARILLGDTRGKGLPAARIAAITSAVFRDSAARPELPLTEVARCVDRAVTGCIGDEDFVTALFVELDSSGWVEVVNCGHPPPLRCAAAGGLDALSPRSYQLPLGLGPKPTADAYTIGLGDRLVLFTDGLLEARNACGQVLRTDQLAPALCRADPEQAADAVLAVVRAHTGGPIDDDIAVLVAQLGARSRHDGGVAANRDHSPA